MSPTENIVNGFVERLKERFKKELAVELFPENPKAYRLNHPVGAILVAYGRSKFGNQEVTDAVLQERSLVIPLTLVFRQLHGKTGVIRYLDDIRLCLTGWVPPHCDNACRPLEERWIGQVEGVWQYAQEFATRTTQIQDWQRTEEVLLDSFPQTVPVEALP